MKRPRVRPLGFGLPTFESKEFLAPSRAVDPSQTPDFLYYDVAIPNGGFDPIPSTFNSSSTENVLNKANDYAVSIARFSIPSESIPLISQQYFEGTGLFTTGQKIVTGVTAASTLYNINNIIPGMVYESATQGNMEYSYVEDVIYGRYNIACSGATTLGSNIITSFTSTLNVLAGMSIEGIGIPANTIIVTVGFGTITISNNATASTATLSMQAYSTLPNSCTLRLSGHNNTGVDSLVVGSYAVQTSMDADLRYARSRVIPTDITSYQQFINYINAELSYAWLDTVNAAGITTYPNPSFVSMADGIARLYIDRTAAADMNIHFSDELYQLFTGLEYKRSTTRYQNRVPYNVTPYSADMYGLNNVTTVTPVGYAFVTNLTSGSPLISYATGYYPSFNLIPGMTISGAGVPALTTIIASDPTTQTATMSANALVTGESILTANSVSFTAIYNTQESSSLWAWSPLQKIVITTNGIPINNQILQQSNLAGNYTQQNSGINVYKPVMIDFEPIVAKQDYTPYQYYPQGPWRFVSLIGDQPLRLIDLQIYWLDFYGNLNPLLIPPNSKASLLLAFVRKDKLGAMMSG